MMTLGFGSVELRASEKRVGNRLRVRLLACVAAGLCAPEAVAQTLAASEDKAVEPTIVVTATKQGPSRVIDIPLSIQVVTGEDIEATGATGLQDVVNKLSGVSGFSTGNGVSNFSIRGIQSISGSVIDASTVGYYLDETPLASATITPDVGFEDLEAIEVLKGPQGTLYGEGSLGGTIRLVTRKPNLSSFEGSFFGGVETTRQGSESYQLAGVINVPLVNEAVALRVVGSYRDDGGFIDDATSGERDVNDNRTSNIRASLRVRPSSAFDIRATYVHQDARGGANAIQAPGLDRALRQAIPQRYRDAFDLATLTLSLERDAFEIVSATSYYERRRVSLRDERSSSVFVASTLGFPNPENGLPQGLIEDTTSPEKTWTQEVRIATLGTGPFSGVLGAYYKNRKIGLFSTSFSPDLADLGFPFPQIFSLDIDTSFREVAAFGEASYKPFERLKITGGFRVFDQKYSGTSRLTIVVPDSEGAFALADTTAVPIRQTTSKVQFKAAVDYKPSDDTLIYALFSQGLRGGGVNTRLLTPDIPRTYGPDSVDNFELGAKARLFGGRLTATLAAYQINYKDIQQPIVRSEGIDYIVNLGRARSRGIELDVRSRVARGFEAGGSFGIIDAQLSEDALIGVTPDLPNPGDATRVIAPDGARLPLVNKYKFNLFGEYSAPLRPNLNLIFRADYEHVGSRPDSLRTITRVTSGGVTTDVPNSIIALDPYDLVSMRVGLEGRALSLSIYADNVFDTRADLAVLSSTIEGTAVNRPRTIGASLRYRF